MYNIIPVTSHNFSAKWLTQPRLMANLDFFGTPKMTVTKFQNRLRSFGAETRAEVFARRNSSKYVTRLKSILTSYKICAAKHFTVSAWKQDHFYLRTQKFTKEILVASEFGRARSYLTAPNLRHFRRDQILEVKTEMPETPIDRPLQVSAPKLWSRREVWVEV